MVGMIIAIVIFFLILSPFDYQFKFQIQQFGYWILVSSFVFSFVMGIRSAITDNQFLFNEFYDGIIYGIVALFDLLIILNGIQQGHFDLF